MQGKPRVERNTTAQGALTYESDELVAAARAAEERGAVRDAITLLEQALARSSQPAHIWAWLGALHADDEQFAAAEAAYRHALMLSPELAAAHSGLAGVLENTNRFEEAEAEYRKSIELRPTAARHVLLAGLQSARGDDQRAIASLRQALLLEDDNEEAMFNLAILVRDEAPTEAEELLRRAIRVDPIYAVAYRELGFVLAGRGAHEEAEHALRTALVLDRDERWAPVYLSSVLWAQGEVAEAKVLLRGVSEMAPLWSLPHRLLANMYRDSGRSDEAETHYRIAAALAPEDADAAFRLADLLTALGKTSEAIEWVTRALDLEAEHRKAQDLLRRLATRREGGGAQDG